MPDRVIAPVSVAAGVPVGTADRVDCWLAVCSDVSDGEPVADVVADPVVVPPEVRVTEPVPTPDPVALPDAPADKVRADDRVTDPVREPDPVPDWLRDATGLPE